jgi:hypothetical protein
MGSSANDAGFFGSRRGLCASLSFARRLVGWQSEGLEAGRCSGGASVSVMEATHLGLGHDPPLARWLNLARPGSVAIEGLVGPCPVVIRELLWVVRHSMVAQGRIERPTP